MHSLLQMQPDLRLTFPNGQAATAVEVQEGVDLAEIFSKVGLPESRPVLVVIGGASYASEADLERVQHLFEDLLAPLAEELGVTVVDGGTDAGVMRLIGQAKAKVDASFSLVGVSPEGLIHLPNALPSNETTALEPNHTHFFLVPGTQWGDESAWLAHIASTLAGNAPSVTVLINGGGISLKDAHENIAQGRPLVVISGTGRLADEIARAVSHPELEVREALSPVLQCGQLHVFNLADAIAPLEGFLRQFLSEKRS